MGGEPLYKVKQQASITAHRTKSYMKAVIVIHTILYKMFNVNEIQPETKGKAS